MSHGISLNNTTYCMCHTSYLSCVSHRVPLRIRAVSYRVAPPHAVSQGAPVASGASPKPKKRKKRRKAAGDDDEAENLSLYSKGN